MKTLRKIQVAITILGIATLITSCGVTTPMLGLSGSNYNSITDDLLLYNSSNTVIDELINAITVNKILVVQTVNAPNSDMLAEKIYESLSKKGKIVGLAKRSELGNMKVEMFDKILFFYPTVYGIETAATRPSGFTKAIGIIPVIGQIIGPIAMKANTYDTRLGAISLHARLVDSKTGQIEWMRVFQGKDTKKITEDTVFEIQLPL
jgi:hypothetical protein